MKKLVLILAAAMFFASCSKKKDVTPLLTPQNATAANLVGNWEAYVDTIYTTTSGKTTYTISSNTGGTHWQFNSDGTGFDANDGAPTIAFTYTVLDGVLDIHTPASSGSPAQDLSLDIVVITASKLGLRDYQGTETEDIFFNKN